MTAALTAVRIDGQPQPCADLTAVITHGRDSVTGGPTASTATITVYTREMPEWSAGQPIEVDTHGLPRFTGTITDVSLSGHSDTLGAALEVTAIGRVATLGWRDIGDEPWPVESPGQRATRILILAGVPFRVADRSNLRVNARDVDRREALGLITEVAQDTGAAVFDTPTGEVVFQHYSARAETWVWFRWVDQPPETTWAQQTDTWTQMEVVSPAAPTPLLVDGCAVLWEPSWVSTSGQVVNSVTTHYGPMISGGERPAVTAINPDSVAVFGRRHTAGPGGLADEYSARERGRMVLDLHSWPHWAIDNVTVLPGKLPSGIGVEYVDADGRAVNTGLQALLGLLCGARVQLFGLPQPAPEFDPVRIVEGWTHTMDAAGETLVLRLSDPAHSYAGITWESPSPFWLWQDVDPAVVWVDVITIDDLVVAA